MNRRELIAGAGALLAVHLGARAQPASRIARVGILSAGTRESNGPFWKPMVESLEALGWKEGRNLKFVARYASTTAPEYPRLAAELAQLKPDLIVCVGPGAAAALKVLGAPIPVVFVIVAEPVKLGLAQSLGRPGGLFTGLATLAPEFLMAKQIELLRELVPKARRVAFLNNPDNPVHAGGRDLRLDAAKAHGLQAIDLQARKREEIEPAFAQAAKLGADMMYLSGDQMPMQHRDFIAQLALKHRLPVMFLFFEHVEAGGLVSYGIDRADLVRRAAAYVDKILKGAAPRDLPIEEPSKYTLAVNAKTARALGIAIPQTLLLRADRVIE